ncbi:MAG TPA: NAD(P)/FAD-dependent oxidoreductase [Mycobacteriales bacterium]|nr:NAD(P)/FAD-dependent oxidoreductase [Mycobacteriales bacterium]
MGGWDAVVIGAGHHGLVAANLLADAGWSVLVLEAEPVPGGAVRSAEITAAGYVSDLCSAFHPLGMASPVLRELDLPAYGLRWRHPPVPLVHVLPDDRTVTLSRDLDETAASLEQFAAGDADAWRAEVAAWDRIGGEVLEALLRPFPPVRAAARMLRTLGSADALRTARLALLSVRRYSEERFRGEGGRVLVAGTALHADLPPDGAGSAVVGWLLAMLGQQVGFPAVEGGGQRLTEALLRRLDARGGEVRCGVPATRIEVRGGAAVAVRTADGDVLAARRAVVADINAPALYADLVGLEHLPARVRTDLRAFDWDDATVKVDWALAAPVPWTAEQARRAGTLHLDLDLDGLTRYAGDLATRTVPERPFLIAGQMTTSDPSRSPAGTESLWAYTHVPRDLDWTPERTRKAVDRIEDVFERHAPGFRDLVVGRAVRTPTGLQADNPNLVGGSIGGGTAALHQQLVFRPLPGLGRPDTPVDRLYLASASAHPGAGVHGACGANAAQAALARNRLATGRIYAVGARAAARAVWGR